MVSICPRVKKKMYVCIVCGYRQRGVKAIYKQFQSKGDLCNNAEIKKDLQRTMAEFE